MTRPGSAAADPLDVRRIAGVEVVRLPALIRGATVLPPWPRVGEIRAAVAAGGPVVLGSPAQGHYLVARPVLDRRHLEPTGETRVLVFPAPDPRTLIEPEPGAAVDELMRLPLAEVTSYVDAVGAGLRDRAAGLAHLLAATSPLADRAHRAVLAQLADLFDGAAVAAMVAEDLGGAGASALDDWTVVRRRTVAGSGQRLADAAVPAPGGTGPVPAPLVRAVPTRQLHLTAGNTPLVAAASLLWGWATKGACVVKPASDVAALTGGLADALRAADPAHPLARHTSIVYWRGGDRAMEDVLLAPGAFDRRVVWGGTSAIRDLIARGDGTPTLVMRPRWALSLIGAGAVGADLPGTVRRAAADSLVADQQACMSSLLHIVEGDAATADAYAAELARVLADWDRHLPHRATAAARSRTIALRRGLLAADRWLVNGSWPGISSAVVRVDQPFDLSAHPGSRVVLVRAVRELRQAFDLVGPDVAYVGVAPEEARARLRSPLVARGVDNVLPLGEAERGYPGRPHDGMRVLGQLVRWVNA